MIISYNAHSDWLFPTISHWDKTSYLFICQFTVSRWFFHGFKGDLSDSCLFSVVVSVVSAKGTNNVLYDSRWCLANQSWKPSELFWTSVHLCVRLSLNSSHFHLLQNQLVQLPPNCAQSVILWRIVFFFSNEGPDPIFPKGGNNEVANMHWRNLKKKHWAN